MIGLATAPAPLTPLTRSLHARIALTPPSTSQAAPRVVCSRVSHSRPPLLLHIKVRATLAHGFSFPAPSPWHSAHEDEPSHQQLSLSDRNDKIAWTMAECALAQTHTPRARPQTSTTPCPYGWKHRAG